MTTTPTPAEFLAQTDPDEDDQEQPQEADFFGPDPMESIAASLRQLVDVMTGGGGPAQLVADLEAEVSELEALHDAKQQLIEDVLLLIKPSTSKLANSVRDLLEPVVAPVEPEAPAPEHPAYDADLEDWQAYARSQGCTEADLEGANRSRIRTLLGLPQIQE